MPHALFAMQQSAPPSRPAPRLFPGVIPGSHVTRSGVGDACELGAARVPQVHDTRKQGLVTMLIQIAREKGVSAYVGEGAVRWAAGPLQDVARLYRLAVEKTGPGVTIYHAVEEQGVSLRAIAESIGKGLKVPVTSISPDKAGEHFGPFGHFVQLDMPASSEWTRKILGWEPHGTGLIEDLNNMNYTQ